MIIVFGSINMDLVAQVAAIARPGETVLSRRAETYFGGKGANQAVAAARASSERPG
jgi:ribokinase